jgi:hypothetical protein
MNNHILYKDGDTDAPKFIQDNNGSVVLDLCRNCGEAEGELQPSCSQYPCPICDGGAPNFCSCTCPKDYD